MTYPIECSDEFGLEGVKDADDFCNWFNNWLQDDDASSCRVEKVQHATQAFAPSDYLITPAPATGNNPNVNWTNNAIQFPRLIAELECIGVFGNDNVAIVAESMDLDPSQVFELVERAQIAWDAIKAGIFNSSSPRPGGSR